MNATAVNTEQHASRVSFHQGRALLQIASTYATVMEIVLEQAQNALDARATKIGILLNQKTRRITITDNGDGVSKQTFEAALGQVCSSTKSSEKLGRFGIGLISPLGKCDSFTFTSCPKGVEQGFIEWTFNTDAIKRQAEDMVVPHKRRTDLAFSLKAPGNGQKSGTMLHVPYRTRVAIVNYSPDKIINRISSAESLVENILERFGATMRKNNVTLSVRFVDENGQEKILENIKPVQFTGKKLTEVQIGGEDGSNLTIFHLYLARKTTKGHLGKVMIGEADNDYRFPFSSFTRTGREYLSSEILDALASGVFEGEILSTGCVLHSNRRNFERNEAFMGFCIALEAWYKEHGKQHIAELQEAREEERYQDLGLRSLATLEELLKDPRFQGLRDIIRGFKRGTVGAGQVAPDEDGVLGTQDEPSLSTDSLDPEDEEGSGKRKASQPDPDHEPFTVTGPKGQRRSIVSNGSLGLQFSHVAMEGSDRLYELDARLGVLHFNIRHPLWVSCEVSDRQVMQLQEFIALKALTWLTVPEDWKPFVEASFDELNHPFVFLIQHSGAFGHLSRHKPVELPAV